MFLTCRIVMLVLVMSASLRALAQTSTTAGPEPEGVEVIVVSGNKTRVPLWQISNGDHTLWLLAYVESVPKDLQWDYSALEQVIGQSQEYISAPGIEGAVSPLLYLNPVNLVRGLRLMKRLQNNPDKKTLADVLPQDTYQRYAQLKAAYFPREKDIEKRRPVFAGMEIPGLIFASGSLATGEETLDSIEPLLSEVDKLIRRNRGIRKTDPSAELEIKGRFGTLAKRAETMVDSVQPELELACFESRLDFVESFQQGVLKRQQRARAWVLNDLDTLIMSDSTAGEDPCDAAMLGTSERTTMTTLVAETRQRWLEAIELALTNNTSTFAMLTLDQLAGEEGLLPELQARGYVVTRPAEL